MTRQSLTALVLLLTATIARAHGSAAPETVITFLQINDVYQITPVDQGTRGGLARVATLQKQIRAQSPHTIFALAGDFLSPSIASRVFKGDQMITVFNSMGVDVATVGNHEFDFGPEILRDRIKGSKFSWTVANVFDKATGKIFGEKEGLKPYIIKTIDGVKVGIFGVVEPELKLISNPGPHVDTKDPLKMALKTVTELRKQGADLIVALTHQDMADDKQMVCAVPGIAFVMGGHEHELLEASACGSLILKTGSDARNVGRIDVHMQKQGKKFQMTSLDWQVIPVTDKTPEDPDTAQIVKHYVQQLSQNLDEVIGHTSVPLDAQVSAVRTRESNVGNFITDALRDYMQTDVAFMNGGGIRSDSLYPSGNLTKRDIMSLLPFENTLVKIRLTGLQLRKILEHSVSMAGEKSGRFLQVSGLRYKYDPKKPVGARVIEVQIQKKPLQDDEEYTAALSSFLLTGGDGYNLQDVKVLIKPENGVLIQEPILEAIRKRQEISPHIEGRIQSL